jgi:NO-binding membrane sensor protein with MHYT domain
VRGTFGAGRRLLLAGAAFFLAVSIWTMHFVGMLAAPLPDDASYLVLPTIISFLLCALVVGVSLFFVSIGDPSTSRLLASALLLGAGIVSMHYVGIHGLAGNFRIEHEPLVMFAAVLIAVVTAYGGLRVFLARHGGKRLALSAVAFGLAVSGMHYTGMLGMRFVPGVGSHHAHAAGLVASQQVLSLVVAFLCFIVAAGFLLFLVPEPRARPNETAGVLTGSSPLHADTIEAPTHVPPAVKPAYQPASRLPIEGPEGTLFLEASEVRSIRADAHYTMVHDGSRERMSPWAISFAEAQLDPAVFLRVHRSHIVALPHITLMRREGDGAVVELDGTVPHLVPVSRSKVAEVRARLGLIRKPS